MRTFTLYLIFALIALAARPARAQTAARPNGPYRGLFGGPADTRQSLTFSGALGGGYTSSVVTNDSANSGPAVPSRSSSSAFNQASGRLAYGLSRSLVGLNASLGGAGTYYASQNRAVFNPNVVVAGHLNLPLWNQASLTVGQNVMYRPLHFFTPFSTLVNPAVNLAAFNPQLAVTTRSAFTSATSARFHQGLTLSRRVSGSLNYGYAKARSSFRDFNRSSQSGSGQLSVRLTKNLRGHLGYGRTEGVYDAPGNHHRVQNDTYDLGLDFDRALSISLTRRVTLSFSTGLAATKFQERTRFRAIGSARLDRRIRRTWDAGLGYNRGVGVDETFQQPVSSDSVTANLGGLLNQRMQFTSIAGASTGAIGASSVGSGFRGVHAMAGLNIALTRRLGLGVDYIYARYRLGGSVQLPTGLLRTLDRQAVLAHLNVVMPLFSRSRRFNATR